MNMMRTFHGFIISLSLTACASSSPYKLSSLHYNESDLKVSSRSIASVDHKSPSNYLSLDLPYTAFEKLRVDLEKSQHVSLQHRGEAHITVITPPEYKKIQKKVSMKEIQALADKMDLKKAPYKLLCVGQGSLEDRGHKESTYYVVVESDRLFQIRKAVQMLYTSKGGKAQDFNPEAFHPHVTLGFTKRDLHLEDGITKDASSCIYSLRPEETAKN
ncbi:2'-5' RNA ligase family protein [Bdellovibrio bacteriovorus]|nr:2'-5' RNA ligase family protein [Bdellovibrio bacteriovorus]